MSGIHKLVDVKEYFIETYSETKDSNFIIDDKNMKDCYNLIYSTYSRVDDKDEQWIAYSSQDYERDTAIDAIKEILDHNSIKYTADTIVNHITNKVDQVGKIFVANKITHKPRIPFYILVLTKLLK